MNSRFAVLVLAFVGSALDSVGQVTGAVQPIMHVCGHKVPAPCAKTPKPTESPYPDISAARKSGTEGVVVLSTVVGIDGLPSEIRVMRTAGNDLDEEAIKTLKQWRFKPGSYNGKPVPVALNIEFALSPVVFSSQPVDRSRAEGVV